jgi:hypothetical protein
MSKIKASIEVQIAAAEKAIRNYESNIRMFESGELTPEVGELVGNRLLLARKRKQLRVLQGQRAITRAVLAYA